MDAEDNTSVLYQVTLPFDVDQHLRDLRERARRAGIRGEAEQIACVLGWAEAGTSLPAEVAQRWGELCRRAVTQGGAQDAVQKLDMIIQWAYLGAAKTSRG